MKAWRAGDAQAAPTSSTRRWIPKSNSSRALAQIEVLNQQISGCAPACGAGEALEASEKRDKESQGASRSWQRSTSRWAAVQELSRIDRNFRTSALFSATAPTSGSWRPFCVSVRSVF